MSISFSITPKFSLFSKKKALTINHALKVSSDSKIQSYGIDDDVVDNPDQYSVADLDSLVLAKPHSSARGFTLSYNKQSKSYSVRVNTPSSDADWQLALQYIHDLAIAVKGEIVGEDERTYTPDAILSFNYLNDIESGLQSIYAMADDKEYEEITIFGYERPVAFNAEMIQQVKNANNSIVAFGDMVRDIQDIDAHSANPMGLELEDGQLKIAYVVGEEVATIIPINPSREINPDMTEDVAEYLVVLAVNSEDSVDIVGEVNYQQFIMTLGDEQYEKIDGAYLLIHPLDKSSMMSIVNLIQS